MLARRAVLARKWVTLSDLLTTHRQGINPPTTDRRDGVAHGDRDYGRRLAGEHTTAQRLLTMALKPYVVSMTRILGPWSAGSPLRPRSSCACVFGCPLGLRPIQQRVPRAVVGPKRVLDDPLALEDELADPTIGAGIVNNE